MASSGVTGQGPKVYVYWPSWTGYMDACIRALHQLTGATINVTIEGGETYSPFDDKRFLDYASSVTYLDSTPGPLPMPERGAKVILLIGGWHIPQYRDLAMRCGRSGAVRIMCMDNQWRGTARQWLGVCAFRLSWKRAFDAAFVPGPRQSRFVRRLGFGKRVYEGHYSCDVPSFERTYHSRAETSSKRFLFVGRLIEQKGVKELADAWRRFAKLFPDWRLVIVGTGPLAAQLAALDNVDALGFVQPDSLPGIMMSADALVHFSKFESWGVVIHEAACAGLALLTTRECGASDAFVRHARNGFLVEACESGQIYDSMRAFALLPPGERHRFSAESFRLGSARTPESWARTVLRIHRDVAGADFC